jgi:hypothetical protein
VAVRLNNLEVAKETVPIDNELVRFHRPWCRLSQKSLKQDQHAKFRDAFVQPPPDGLAFGLTGKVRLVSRVIEHRCVYELVNCGCPGCVVVVPVR